MGTIPYLIFFINVEWKIFLNSSLIWSDKIEIIKFSVLKGRHSNFEIILKDKIRSKTENRGIKIREHKTIIKSSHSRAKKKIQNLENFNSEI